MAGIEQREAGRAGQLGDRLGAVDRAEQGEAVGVHLQVGGALGIVGMRGERDDRVGAVDRVPQPEPLRLPVGDRRERFGDLQRGRQARSGALAAAEPPASGGPLAQLGQRRQGLLEDEFLDGLLVGQPQVDQQFGERPGGELSFLRLPRLRQIGRGEAAIGDQASRDGLFATRHGHIANRTFAQRNGRFEGAPAGRLDVNAARRFRVCQAFEQVSKRRRLEIAAQHARPLSVHHPGRAVDVLFRLGRSEAWIEPSGRVRIDRLRRDFSASRL